MKTLLIVTTIISALYFAINYLANQCFDDNDDDMDWPNSYT